MNINWLKKIESMMVFRYSERYEQFGVNPKTLGWDSNTNQNARFLNAINSVSISGKSILDVGCGFSDFYSFLQSYYGKTSEFEYYGVDINQKLITECKSLHPEAKYDVRNILSNPLDANSWDIVTMFGLLNYKLQDYDNLSYTKEFIKNAFSTAKECLIVDMLSSKRNLEYPQEDFVFYHDPAVMLDYALSLTPYVKLIHSGQPIPQKEFILMLGKNPF